MIREDYTFIKNNRGTAVAVTQETWDYYSNITPPMFDAGTDVKFWGLSEPDSYDDEGAFGDAVVLLH